METIRNDFMQVQNDRHIRKDIKPDFIMKWIIYSFILTGAMSTYGKSINFHGQASTWCAYNQKNQSQLGLRYLPDFFTNTSLSKNWSLDAQFTWQAMQWWQFDHWEFDTDDKKLDPYRLWIRLSTNQFEARMGLQKISFGSARLIRPLMWFDRLDPRDPLQLTDGVYGLLLKYTFINNTNIWFWGLIGNEDEKGWDIFSTKQGNPEWGGRIQSPLGPGEIGASCHYRKADVSAVSRLLQYPDVSDSRTPVSSISESRFALDGCWDIEIGLWFEGALFYMDWDMLPFQFQKMTTLGLDYTFGIGNGLYCLAEHFMLQMSTTWNNSGTTRQFTALSLNYPVNLIDNLTMMIYHDWDEKSWYRLLDWQRSYDHWQFHVIGFWNPDEFELIQFRTGQSLFTGKGIQCIIVFNH